VVGQVGDGPVGAWTGWRVWVVWVCESPEQAESAKRPYDEAEGEKETEMH
jgi:G:T-mismatch repair DNA endonuclease (very short patch repair protein)